MDEQKQDDQQEPIYNISVPIQDTALKTCWERWTIEMSGERGSERSVLVVRHDNDNIFCAVSKESFFCTLSYRIKIIFKQTCLIHRFGPNKYCHSITWCEGVLHNPRAPDLEPYHKMLFSTIPRYLFLGRGVLSLCKRTEFVYFKFFWEVSCIYFNVKSHPCEEFHIFHLLN